MKKIAVIVLLSFISGIAIGQSYYNEWIDYNKTYYKFKVGSTGLYRITPAELNSIGLGNEAAQNFQLWRNGKEVALYTSVASGALGANGYIEFWGEKNDGVTDKDLYRLPEWQLSDKESLLTDTAAFFLTVNTAGNNLRFAATANNVSGNTLSPEPYFIYSLRHNFKNRIHKGRASVVGSEYVYSSTYDIGEMWASRDIAPSTPETVNYNNLFVAPNGPAATFRASVAGSTNSDPTNPRTYQVLLNNTEIIKATLNNFNAQINSNASVPISLLASNNATFRIVNNSANINDRIVAGFLELNYPRQFNFTNQTAFAFTLAASAAPKYLEITFSSAGSAPVLYDVTNRRRCVAEVSTPGVAKFVVEPSATNANLVFISQPASVAKVVSSFQTRTFVNYTTTANQGDYLIITHPSLQTPVSGANQVDQYRAYRNSAPGGSFNSKIYDIEQLTDQFGYGIKKNPLGIKNFLRFARATFSIPPKFSFIIGRGLTYDDYRENENNPQADRLNLVPTWGYPASDVLLASDNMDPVMNTPIGRLSILSSQELADYLDKVKQYEQAQQNTNQTTDNKAWMKNIIHVVGANDTYLDASLTYYMKNYEAIIEDTLYGGEVTNFNKTSTGTATTITGNLMKETIEKGVGLINYFGHSSASKLDYNLDDPAAYNNPGKYPMFVVNGCNAGDLFSFDTSRFSQVGTISERFVLAKNRGSIGFIASTHFGITNYLDTYNYGLYRSIGITGYGKSIAYNINEAISGLLATYGANNFEARLHAEETTLHGDPALKMNSFALPDFVVEEPQIRIEPNIVSVADTKFTVKAYIYNIAKATGDSVTVQVKQQYPDGTSALLYNQKIRSIRYRDSLNIVVPIIASRDKGENKITVSVDTDNRYNELSETNNTATRSFIILEDELRPVYPYDLTIVNRTNIKLTASTANPLVGSRQYLMEIDTTENYNSPAKVSRSITASGGVIEFDPGISFRDSTVYYWRVASVPATGSIRWNNASFIYLNGSAYGFNQSHRYQHLKSATNNIYLDTTNQQWKFAVNPTSLFITHAIYPVSGTEDNHFSIAINGIIDIASSCLGHSVIFNVFDPITMKPYFNQTVPSVEQQGAPGGFMGSARVCYESRRFNFEFSYLDTAGRRSMRDFMDWVPAGAYVTARLILSEPFDQNPFVDEWKKDEQVYGAGNSVYSRIKNAGFNDIDSFNRPRTWAFVYKKNDPSYTPVSKFSAGLSDMIILNLDLPTPGTAGTITSPTFGPALAWKKVIWRGLSLETPSNDVAVLSVIGITSAGQADTLYRLNTLEQDVDISEINAGIYPYIRLSLKNQDAVTLTPYQLRYWRLLYSPAPEGALAPNLTYRSKDTLEVGEKIDFSIAFKNVSDAAFRDSIKVNIVVLDNNNVATIIPVSRKKALQPGDTAVISALIDTRAFSGNNTLFIDVNPNMEQPEQYRFNNFLYKNFYVRPDTHNPLMDVTFDGVHILNGDIVSAKPKIVIKLKDEAKFLALDDTSLAAVFVRYPGGTTLRRFAFGTDTLRFVPADLSTGKNEATIEFSPAFLEDSDGDFYELIVRAKDKSGNNAGNLEYHVSFQVYNKPMISNMFNYPNPFTTSTAFVFTITGSDVPQNIRIQIMTVTGKVVKEITRQELGPLHIGRNITEYKWDGTDQYGGKLGNGVYLYRVITNQNGAALEKFKTVDPSGNKVDTDKYFNKGYGKMYLMR